MNAISILLLLGCHGSAAPGDTASGASGPRINTIEPTVGPTAGGTWVTLVGEGLEHATRVRFGSAWGTIGFERSDHALRVFSPHHQPGTVDVEVLLYTGESAVLHDAFTYNGGDDGGGLFVDVTGDWLPAEARAFQDAAVGDFDGDGRADVFLPGYFGDPSLLLLAEGDGFVEAPCQPETSGVAVHAEAGDVDENAALDLVVINEGARDQVFFNDGTGCLVDMTDSRMPDDDGMGEGGDLGDLDGDGDLDLVVANLGAGEPDALLINLGNGRFVDASHAMLEGEELPTYSIELFDADGDGMLDAAVAEYGAPDRIWINAGDGGAMDVRELGDGDDLTTQLLPADADGDGCPDLFQAVYGGVDHLWLGDCTGAFVESDQPALAAVPEADRDSYDGEWFDLDGDGDLDLAVAVTGGQSRLFRNDDGELVDVTAEALPTEADHHYAVEALDADGDGDLDLLWTSWAGEGTTLTLQVAERPAGPSLDRVSPAEVSTAGGVTVALRGAGLGGAVAAAFGGTAGEGLAVVDDTWLTVTVPAGEAGPAEVTVTLDDGTVLELADRFAWVADEGSAFTDVTASALPADTAPSTGVVAVDLDGDGALDLAVSDEDVGLRLLLGDGEGRFEAAAALAPELGGGAQDVAAADLDGDGDPDLCLATGDAVVVLLNDGSGGFGDAATTLDLPATAVALADLDGDGAPDLVAASDDADHLALGDGAGGFGAAVALPGEPVETAMIAPGDLDGDGDVDLVAVGFLALDRVLLNDGAAGFSLVDDPFGDGTSLQSYHAALADADGDGDLDVLVAQGGATGQNGLYLNDGSAGFSDGTDRLPAVAYGSSAVEAADLDGDGDADFVVANFWGPNEVYVGEGGSFTDPGWLPDDDHPSVAVALADFDGDGKVDVFFADYGEQDRLYLAR